MSFQLRPVKLAPLGGYARSAARKQSTNWSWPPKNQLWHNRLLDDSDVNRLVLQLGPRTVGSVCLQNARARTLIDQPDHSVLLQLDRFAYERIQPMPHGSAGGRLAWLRQNLPGAVGAPDNDELSDPAAHCDNADFVAGSYPRTRDRATTSQATPRSSVSQQPRGSVPGRRTRYRSC